MTQSKRIVVLHGINFVTRIERFNDAGEQIGGRGHLGQLTYPTENLPEDTQASIKEMILKQCDEDGILVDKTGIKK
jgi:hypothetical protein